MDQSNHCRIQTLLSWCGFQTKIAPVLQIYHQMCPFRLLGKYWCTQLLSKYTFRLKKKPIWYGTLEYLNIFGLKSFFIYLTWHASVFCKYFVSHHLKQPLNLFEVHIVLMYSIKSTINILLTSSNIQISEFRIPDIYNKILFILFFFLIKSRTNSQQRHL